MSSAGDGRRSAGSARTWLSAARIIAAAALAGMAGLSACSAPECNPPIPDGAKYRVTVLSEDAGSNKCHIVDGVKMSPFEVTAAHVRAAATVPDCSVTPAATAPKQMDILIQSCTPTEHDMLGVYCQMQYPSTCAGAIDFHFEAPPGVAVDWTAPVIENARFVIHDYTMGCLPDVGDCRDVYNVRLERE